MRSHHSRRRHIAACALALGAVLTTSACSSTGGSSSATDAASEPAATASVSASSTAAGRSATVNTTLVSATSDLHRVGPNNSQVFGWNLLVGPGKFLNEDIEVRLQGSVDYIDGNGSFGGFMRLVALDGSEVAMNLEGTAVQAAAAEGAAADAPRGTDLRGTLTFIGSSGRYADLIVNGEFLATRNAEVGAPVITTMNLKVQGQVLPATSVSPTASPAAS